MSPTRRDLFRTLASAATVATLTTVALAEASPVDVSTLPAGDLGLSVMMIHNGPDGTRDLALSIDVDPDPAGVPRLQLHSLHHLEGHVVDPATEPALYQAVTALVAAIMAAADSPLAPQRS